MNQIVQAIREQRVLGILRSADARTAVASGELLMGAGIRAVEVSLTTPSALDAIAQLREQLPSECYLGVGTVTTPEQVCAAAAAGAQFVVSPNMDIRVIEISVELGLTSIPGSGTASEALQARSAGADLVKLFPASTWSPAAVKDLLTALPDLPLVPTGGIGLGEAVSWVRSGAVAVGLGGALVRGEPAESTTRIKDLLAQLAEEP